MISLRDILTNPLTAILAVLTAVQQFVPLPVIDAIVGVLWGQLSILFTGTSIFAFTVLPNVSLGPLSFLTNNVQIIAVVLGVAYGLKLLSQVGEKIAEQIDQ